MKIYIDEELNPAQLHINDPLKKDFQELKTTDQNLDHLNINNNEYERALSISDEDSFQIHTKRPPNSCFVNGHFAEGLQAWNANIDIQSVLEHYKAMAYMCAYKAQLF